MPAKTGSGHFFELPFAGATVRSRLARGSGLATLGRTSREPVSPTAARATKPSQEHHDMDTVMNLVQGIVTLIGFLTLALVGIKTMVKDNQGLSNLLSAAQLISIKVAGVALVAYVMLLTYAGSRGTLSIQTIGLYVACVGILISLLKDINVKGSLISDVQAVVTHRAKTLQSSLAEQAEQARKAGAVEAKHPRS